MALEHILADRRKTHGDFAVNSRVGQAIKQIVRDMAITPLVATQMEGLDYIASKIGRICSGNPNVPDHWDDIAGYATLEANRLRGQAAVAQQKEEAHGRERERAELTKQIQYGGELIDRASQRLAQLDGCKPIDAIRTAVGRGSDRLVDACNGGGQTGTADANPVGCADQSPTCGEPVGPGIGTGTPQAIRRPESTWPDQRNDGGSVSKSDVYRR